MGVLFDVSICGETLAAQRGERQGAASRAGRSKLPIDPTIMSTEADVIPAIRGALIGGDIGSQRDRDEDAARVLVRLITQIQVVIRDERAGSGSGCVGFGKEGTTDI